MRTRIRVALAVAFLAAAAAVAVSAMAFTGRDASGTQQKARSPAASVEQIRGERRESFRRTGCSKHMRRDAPDV